MKEIVYDFSRHNARNAQHVQFVTSVLGAVSEEVAEAQGFASQREAFAVAATDEVLCFQPDKGYLDTPEVEAADRARDNLFLLYDRIFRAYADYCPNAEKQQAGKTLTFAFREAEGAKRADYMSETAILADLVAKLATEPYLSALSTLGFEDVPDEIGAANDAFNTLYVKRAAEEKNRAFSATMKELRPVTDEAFNTLAKAINALYAVNEMVTNDASKRTALELVIDDVNTLVVRLRKSMGGGTSSLPDDGEKPGDLDPVEPEEPEGEEGGERPGGL